MTLYYSLVFAILMSEMVVFMGLIVPLPFKIKRKLFNFISESPVIAKLQYGLKICFIFILILFIDSVNRVYRVQTELHQISKDSSAEATMLGGTQRMEVQARKFYSQRNMYLCGFTLFLSLILNRTYMMILDVLRLEEKVKLYENDAKNNKAQGEEMKKLSAELAKKDKELLAMKKQAEGLQREYARIGDEYSKEHADNTPKKDR